MKKENELKQIEESNYFVSSNGNVFSTRSGKMKKLKPTKIISGYLMVSIYIEGKKLNKLIHRLVLEHFGEGYSEDKQVNHLNFNKQDNDISNLEMVTPKQNMDHYWSSNGRRTYRIKITNRNGNIMIVDTLEQAKIICEYKSRTSVMANLKGLYKSKKGYIIERVSK